MKSSIFWLSRILQMSSMVWERFWLSMREKLKSYCCRRLFVARIGGKLSSIGSWWRFGSSVSRLVSWRNRRSGWCHSSAITRKCGWCDEISLYYPLFTFWMDRLTRWTRPCAQKPGWSLWHERWCYEKWHRKSTGTWSKLYRFVCELARSSSCPSIWHKSGSDKSCAA